MEPSFRRQTNKEITLVYTSSARKLKSEADKAKHQGGQVKQSLSAEQFPNYIPAFSDLFPKVPSHLQAKNCPFSKKVFFEVTHVFVLQVKKNAIDSVKRRGGDVNNERHVVGQYELQFGVFQGQTFCWLLENALGYAAYM